MISNHPIVNTTSQYNLNWKLGPLNLQGKGNANFYAGKFISINDTLINERLQNLFSLLFLSENVTARSKLFGSKYLKNGTQYLKIDRCEVNLKFGKVRVHFWNLFNGNKPLERVANDIINQSLDNLIDDVTQPMEQVMATKLVQSSNQIFSLEPFDDFFPLI